MAAFPYTEDFETSNGGWTAGGYNADWAWGAPAKNVIGAAGSGTKCWITGTLTGNAYNDNENSWLQSPCFDFTHITLPYISFLVFWDTESGYDGAALQYSDDNGISWQSLGAYGDAPTGCTSDNWYNQSSIRYAVQPEGWSGSYNNQGSGGWVTAYHNMPELAGKSKVLFRFVFGAGKIQNNYNGFAVDNIYIGEVPKGDQVSFTYTCRNDKQVTFLPVSSACVSSLQWNFGDAASGNENTASGSGSSTHTFTSPGNYTVTVSGKGSNGTNVTSTQSVIIPNVIASVQTPVVCAGATGAVQAEVTNTTAAASYTWNTEPAINAAIAQVKAGYYTVTVSVTGGCSNSASVIVTEPPPLAHLIQTTEADCNNLNGSVSLTESGGSFPYLYTWSPNVSVTAAAGSLSAGIYQITVTDKNLCTDTAHVNLLATPSALSHMVTTNAPDCGLSNGSIAIITGGGMGDYTYQWMPDVSHTENAQQLPAGNYTIVASDMNKCKDTAQVTLTNKPLTVSLGNDTVICNRQTLLLKTNTSYASYLWNDGSALPTKEIGKQGNYSLQVTNAGGCRASDTIRISVGCGDLVFPSAFSPNGDGVNEEFGPTGGLSLITSYRLLVYNRYGGIVFQSANPYQRWKGDVNGTKMAGTYTFVAVYLYQGKTEFKKGTITMLL